MNIRPGDIVRVKEGDTVPADLVIVSSSYEDSVAYYRQSENYYFHLMN